MSSPTFVTAAVDHFTDTGEWPSVRLLQNVLTEVGDPADARREAKRLRYGHGSSHNGRIVLAVRGIYHADPNHPLLEDFERALRLAMRLYKRGVRRAEATISYRDLIAKLSFTEEQAHRGMALLESESLVASGGAGNDVKTISPRIRRFLGVRDVERYVKKRKWLDRRQRARRLAGKPCVLLRWFGGNDSSILAKIVVGALAFVAGSLLLGVIVWGVYWVSEPARKSLPPPLSKPEAREGGDRHLNVFRKSAAARSGG